mgnify:CR=1 FL=1
MHEPKNGLMEQLQELAGNLWWSWQPEIRALFRDLDPELWREVYQNPVAMLRRLDTERVLRRIHHLEMQAKIHRMHRRLHEYLESGGTWGAVHAGPLAARPVGYFSAEFGLHHSLPIYSGGLGVLAGDHLKSMSDLGVPAVGVGILYHQGYVHQEIDREGRQQDRFEPLADEELGIRPLTTASGHPLSVGVELPGRTVRLKVWEVVVGRTRLPMVTRLKGAGPIAWRQWLGAGRGVGGGARRREGRLLQAWRRRVLPGRDAAGHAAGLRLGRMRHGYAASAGG